MQQLIAQGILTAGGLMRVKYKRMLLDFADVLQVLQKSEQQHADN